MTKLSVNVNKIATLRNTRPQLNIPDLIALSRIALDAGADGLTIHPRPDQRHIRDQDIDGLAELLQAYPKLELNIEGNPFEGRYLEQCGRVRPHQCTLVPDSISQSTSDHGWRFPDDLERLQPVIRHLQALGCRVSLFMDPNVDQIPWVAQAGAERVELYTEPFAARYARHDPLATKDYVQAAHAATEAGLMVNAGHDPSLANLAALLQAVPDIAEVSIGHALIADALVFGLSETVRKYLEEIESSRRRH